MAEVCIYLASAERIKGYESALKTVDYAIGAGIAGFVYRGALSTIAGIDRTYSFLPQDLRGAHLLTVVVLTIGIGALRRDIRIRESPAMSGRNLLRVPRDPLPCWSPPDKGSSSPAGGDDLAASLGFTGAARCFMRFPA